MNEEVIENNLYPSATAKDSSNFEISYRSLFESARDGILLLDGATGKIIDVNPAAARLFDCSRDELLERKIWQTEMFGEVGSHIFREARGKGFVRYAELPLKIKDGRHLEVELTASVHDENGVSVMQCSIRDAAEREKSKLSAQVEHQRLRLKTSSPMFPESSGKHGASLTARRSASISSANMSKNCSATVSKSG